MTEKKCGLRIWRPTKTTIKSIEKDRRPIFHILNGEF